MMMPSGIPITSPAIASNVDCHAIATRVLRRVKPIERNTASSWRRRRTVVTSACATVAIANSAKKIASVSGSDRRSPSASTAGGNAAGDA